MSRVIWRLHLKACEGGSGRWMDGSMLKRMLGKGMHLRGILSSTHHSDPPVELQAAFNNHSNVCSARVVRIVH